MINNTHEVVIPATQLVMISSNIQIWSATTKVEREHDLPDVSADALPPKQLVTDGRKTLIDSKELAPLENVRKSIERFLKQKGFSFMGSGIAVTQERAAEFLQVLPMYRQQFADALDELCQNLNASYEAQEEKFPDWAFMLGQARMTEAQVRQRCRFGINIYRMSMPEPGTPDSPANACFKDMAEQALPSLMESIRADAASQLEKVRGKSKMIQSQLLGVRSLVEKMEGFAFLDPTVGPAAAALTEILARMPTTGSLSMTNTTLCVSVLEMLVSPHQLLANGRAALEDQLQSAKDLSVQPELGIPAAFSGADVAAQPATALVANPVRRKSAMSI